MKKTVLGVAAASLLLVSAAPAVAEVQESKLKIVYGWAHKSGKSAILVKPHHAALTELGESGIIAWDLGKRKGPAIKIQYTEGLVFHQVNKKCGKRAAGYPHDTSSKKAFGTRKCDPIDLYRLLKTGRIPVRVVYDPAGPMAVKVTEIVIP